MNESANHPPKSAQRLLCWFLKPALQEEVLGDLDEKFQVYAAEGNLKVAQLRYWYQVLNYLRPFAIRNDLFHHLNPLFMLRHNLKVSSRNLIRDKGYSLLNIGGLALGMTVAILISLWVWDELSYNSTHKHKDQIAQLMRVSNGQDERFTSTSHPTAVGQVMRNNYDNYFQEVVMVRKPEGLIVSFGDRHFSELGNFMQPEAPELFTIEMLEGSRAGLEEINSVLLAESLAKKLFGNASPIGETVTFNGQVAVAVTGVYKDFPRNSHFWQSTYLSSLDLYFNLNGADPNTWENYNMNVYARIMPNTTFELASNAIKNELRDHMSEEDVARKDPELFLHSMDKWHLYSEFDNGVAVTSKQLKFVWINSLIGLFVLLLAGINFVNLSTARSERRAKEIGVRKSLGSSRAQLFYQFMSESLLISIAGFVTAIGMLYLLLPWFNELADKDLSVPVWNYQFWLLGIGFTLLTGLLAGGYPSLYLSAFKPVS
ncbi:MAG: ABC transporter permease, partial [Bacteroidota bacterium]